MKKIFFWALSLALAAGCFLAVSPKAGLAATVDDLYLHIGSPLALAGGKILPLDHDDPDISPRLHHNHTLVPLRFISEYFGAEVSYEAAAKTAVITVNGQTARFSVGANTYTLNGATVAMDAETLLVEGKALVPLRVICEAVLGLPIEYREGVIHIGAKKALTDEQVQAVKAKIGQYLQVNTVEELNRYIQPLLPLTDDLTDEEPAFALGLSAPAPQSESANAAPAPAAAAETGDYSLTNVQTEGVDEGDIIKTDGKYIYICAGNQVKVVEATGGSLRLAAQIALPDSYRIQDMYVDGVYVVLVGSYYYRNADNHDTVYLPYPMDLTFARVYDLSDPRQAKLHRQYAIQGQVITTRKQGDYLYLLTSNYTYHYDNTPDIRPYVVENGGAAPIPLERMLVAPHSKNWQLITLSSLNIRDAAEKTASKTLPGSAAETYMSNQAFYVAGHDYYSGNNGLAVTRFSLDGAKIAYGGSGTVKGSLNDQFSMDEYEGCLRLATTEQWPNNTNHLFILDENMEICGQVNDYAPGERIYSARFMGKRGYVVTFRQMDPLFVFDLADPVNPTITGELKVPGFSNYLHPVAENVLLGVGQDSGDLIFRDSSGQEVVVGQRTGGLKLSLFDVSDMGKPKELDTLILGSQGYSELFYNHKAAMFKADNSLLAFPANLSAADEGEYFSGALLISYAGNKLSEHGRIADENLYGDGDTDYSYWYASDRRIVYIGNTLYYLQGSLLRAYDLATLKETGRLKL